MIHKIFSVYDSKVESFLPPFFVQSKGAALRSFMDAVGQEGHQFSKHAADFTLFELGEFDDFCGKFELHATPISIALALEFIRGGV